MFAGEHAGGEAVQLPEPAGDAHHRHAPDSEDAGRPEGSAPKLTTEFVLRTPVASNDSWWQCGRT
eukprot:15457569-Alexandrium_andersonii.AAC.1